MKIRIDKEREIRVILNVLKIIGETLSSVIGMFIGAYLVFAFINQVLSRNNLVIYDLFTLCLIVPLLSALGVYFIGKVIKHRGSFLWTILASIGFYIIGVLFAIIFLIPYFRATDPDTSDVYNIFFTIGCLASLIGSAIGFHLSREVKKVWKAVGLTLAGIFLAGLIFHTALDIYGRMAMSKEIQEIKRKGEPVTMDYFAEAVVPDGQNAALIYKQIPKLAIERGELDIVSKLDELNTDSRTWTDKQKKDIPVILAKNSKAFELAHEAALKPYCNFNIDYNKFWDFEEIKITKDFFHLLSLKSALDKENGQMDEAIERIYDGFAASKASGKYKNIIGSLIGNVGSRIMVDRLKQLLYNTDITLQQYQKLCDHLKKQGESAKADLLTGFFHERCRTIMTAKQLFITPPLSSFLGYWPFITTYRLYGIDCLKDMTDMIEMIKKPYWETKDQKVKFRKIRFFSLNYNLTVDKLNVAELAVALRMYKIKNGKYPASLKELVPSIIPNLPLDSATGEDMVYHLEGNGFVVYSFGENARDDKGKSDDIVWKSAI